MSGEEIQVAAIVMVGVPIIIFTLIVLPIWLILHYSAKRKAGVHLSGEEQELMNRMIGLLEKMEGRIGTLEKILDAEDPRWRSRVPVSDRM